MWNSANLCGITGELLETSWETIREFVWRWCDLVWHYWGNIGDLGPLGRSGALWDGLDRSGTLWGALGRSGAHWDALARFGTLWDALGRSGTLCGALGRSGTLRGALGRSGMLCGALGRSGAVWDALARFGTLWDALGRSGTLWGALGRSGTLWDALGCSGTLCGALGRSRQNGVKWSKNGRKNGVQMEPESNETLVKIQLEIFASSESSCQVSKRFFQWFHQTFSISAIFSGNSREFLLKFVRKSYGISGAVA